jgi:hypothetical protein
MHVIAAPRRALRAGVSAGGLEAVAALALAAAIAVVASAHLLRPDVVEGDALVHQYWMRQFADPALFTDSLTASLRGSERYPDGYEGLFWLASHVADPVAFGEWLGIALMAAAGWLVFAIVREHTDRRPAAWIGAVLFLSLQGHRFFGGFPRGFLHVVVLATVLLALRGRERSAALAAGGGALFYPPASLLALGVLSLSALRRRDGRFRLNTSRLRTAALAGALAVAAVFLPQLLEGGSLDVMSASEARRYPEFGEHGDLHFFTASVLDYLRQNRSGFDLRATGSLLLLASAGLLVVRRGDLRPLRAEVLAMPAASLAAYALAQATLFRLYLPHRYTYPLLAFGAIAIALWLRPAWEGRPRRQRFALALAPVPLAYVALTVLPLGPMRPLGELPLWVWPALAALVVSAALVRTAAAGALLTGVALIAAVVALPGRVPPGQACPSTPAVQYLATLPKSAVIAGDPMDLKCLPVSASRAVVISTQLAFSYERGYFLDGRARMFAMLRAYYGPSVAALTELRRRYGATHLLVDRRAIRRERVGERARWPRGRQPYGALVADLLASGSPASLHLPTRCRRWHRGRQAIYDLRCL